MVKGSNPGKKWYPPLHLGAVAIEKEFLGHPRLRSPTLLIYIYIYIYIYVYIFKKKEKRK